MCKLVYRIQQPLGARDYGRYGIDAWLDRGWAVEVWGLSYSVAPHLRSAPALAVKAFPGFFGIATEKELAGVDLRTLGSEAQEA
jgi:hypothetical protein